jgi:RHS repeat-associated protein
MKPAWNTPLEKRRSFMRILTGGGGTYVYDGAGNRVKKTVSSTTTLYWPGAGSLLDESNSTGSTMGKQVQFAGLLVWHEDTSGSGLFLFHDHLGSTRVTGTASGSLDDDNDYESYGTLFHNYGSSPSDNIYLFTGDESDSETTSDYAIFRNLGTTMGRFNRPDPYDGSYDVTNPQSLNRYSYALNSPLLFIDPSGLDLCAEDDGGDDDDDYGENAFGCEGGNEFGDWGDEGWAMPFAWIRQVPPDPDEPTDPNIGPLPGQCSGPFPSDCSGPFNQPQVDLSYAAKGGGGGGGAGGGGTQASAHQQQCDAIYQNYVSQVRGQRWKNFVLVAGAALGAARAGKGFLDRIYAAEGAAFGADVGLWATNWNMDGIQQAAIAQLNAAGCATGWKTN